MPQRMFWTAQHANAVRFDITLDPTTPLGPLTWEAHVFDQDHKVMEWAYTAVPAAVTHECVRDLNAQAWDAYLFGEPHDLSKTVARLMPGWRQYAAAHPLIG